MQILIKKKDSEFWCVFFFFLRHKQSLKMFFWNTVNSLVLQSTSVPLRQKAIFTYAFIHSFIHSSIQTMIGCLLYARLCQVLGIQWSLLHSHCSSQRTKDRRRRKDRKEDRVKPRAKMGGYIRLFNPRRSHMSFQHFIERQSCDNGLIKYTSNKDHGSKQHPKSHQL